MAMSLTKLQAELLQFCESYIASNGYGPSLENIRVALALTSKSHVFRLLEALEARGRIKRLRNKPRAIEIITQREAA